VIRSLSRDKTPIDECRCLRVNKLNRHSIGIASAIGRSCKVQGISRDGKISLRRNSNGEFALMHLPTTIYILIKRDERDRFRHIIRIISMSRFKRQMESGSTWKSNGDRCRIILQLRRRSQKRLTRGKHRDYLFTRENSALRARKPPDGGPETRDKS